MKKKSFIFIGDLIELQETEVNIYNSLFIKKAKKDQVDFIRRFLKNSIDSIITLSINKYETFPEKKGMGYNYTYIDNRDEWKYYIIEHDEVSNIFGNLQTILSLSSIDLTLIFEKINNTEFTGIIQDSLKTINYFHDDSMNVFLNKPTQKLITNEEIREILYIKELLDAFKTLKYPNIQKGLKDFQKIKDISARSPFKILSCFSILELLLTSYRSGTDNTLSNQIRKKTNLINNQLSNPITIDRYFKVPDTFYFDSIIAKLYQYRNDIAHGNISNFEKEFHIFQKGEHNIVPFLTEVIRKIIVYSLENPQLVTDLKEC